MTDEPFDWQAMPRRPLTSEDVWELMRNGCNAHEVATAGGVSLATALGMMNEAVPRAPRRPVLARKQA